MAKGDLAGLLLEDIDDPPVPVPEADHRRPGGAVKISSAFPIVQVNPLPVGDNRILGVGVPIEDVLGG